MSALAKRYSLQPGPGYAELPRGDLRSLRFGLARVPADGAVELDTQGRDALIVVLDAPDEVRVAAGGRELRLPSRRSVFDEPPGSAYVPAGAGFELQGPVLAGVFQARAHEPTGDTPYVILPGEVTTVERGRDNYARHIRNIVPRDGRQACLLAGETLSPPGNWSSSPPHKHDRQAPPAETRLEEIYLFRTRPGQGFALQHSYHSGGPSRTFAVQDLDVVTIPSGYHPVVAAPGYELYYLWCLAGMSRELCWQVDPSHAWVDSE